MGVSGNDISGVRTVGVFLAGRACSDTLFHMVAGAYGHPAITEERAAMSFAGGVLQHGYQCGMIWGSALAAGAQAHRRFGPGPRAQVAAVTAAAKAVECFRSLNDGRRDCFDITELDETSSKMRMVTYFLLKGGTIGCFRRAARYAPAALRAIESAFSADAAAPPPPVVSCAAFLAERTGASDLHQTMVSGLAGGIGLSGGGCGALGAAIWLAGMDVLRQHGGKLAFKDPKTTEVLERYIKAAEYRFECSEIVGRNFQDVGDHAAWVRNGGCARILDALA